MIYSFCCLKKTARGVLLNDGGDIRKGNRSNKQLLIRENGEGYGCVNGFGFGKNGKMIYIFNKSGLRVSTLIA